MTFPDLSVQAIATDGNWWQRQSNPKLERGALIECWVPYVDQTPLAFEPVARTSATEHDKAVLKVSALKVEQPLRHLALPVAAMPNHPKEVWAAYRAKRRVCLVLSAETPLVDKALVAGKPKHATAALMLVAPYFGVAQHANRAGYNQAFIDRVVRCDYPQFMVDWLPHEKGEQSLLRLDQLQPIGRHHHSYKLHGFKLSTTALEIMDSWLEWLLQGNIDPDHLLADAVQLIRGE